MNSTEVSRRAIPAGCIIYALLDCKPDNLTAEVYATVVSGTAINTLTLPFTIVLNLLVMIAVKTKPRLRTMSNVVVACLAATDTMVGLIVQPLRISVGIFILQGDTSSESCILQETARNVSRFLCGTSLIHLVLMSGERFLAISYPYQYTTTVTEGRILVASAIAWVTVALISFPISAAINDVLLSINTVALLLSLAIVIIGQFVLYREARRHEKEILSQQVSAEAREKFLKEKKALKLTTFIVVAVLICYLPIFVVRIIVSKVPLNVSFIIYYVGGFLPIINSLINPIIYAARIRPFRVAFFEILLRKSYKQAEQMEMRVFGSPNAVGIVQTGQERDINQQEEEQENIILSNAIDVIPNLETRMSNTAEEHDKPTPNVDASV
ncbi:adenosine receptor A1-like [Oculina patagonica]